MPLIETLTRWSATLPPVTLAAGLLALFAVFTFLTGLVRTGLRFFRFLPLLGYLLAGCALMVQPAVIPTEYLWIAVGAGGLMLVIHLGLAARAERAELSPPATPGPSTAPAVENPPPATPPKPPALVPAATTRGWLLAALLVGGVLLFYRLGTYSGPLMVWETLVGTFPNDSFAKELGGYAGAGDPRASTTLAEFAALRLRWDDGLVSTGHDSLLYGVPTYALIEQFGFSAWSLRVVSAVLTLGSIALAYALGRRFFSPSVAAAAAFLIALNPHVLFAGRYASSLSATLFAVLLAVYCVWAFLDRDRWAPLWGLLSAAALYLATLHYAPGRLVVVMLIAFVVLHSVVNWRRIGWRRGLGLVLFVGGCVGVWVFQRHHEATDRFVNARGEQLITFLRHPGYIREYLKRDVPPERLTDEDRALITYRVVTPRLHELAALFRPYRQADQPGVVLVEGERPAPGVVLLESDPPRLSLIYLPVLLFLAWGTLYALLHITQVRCLILLAWIPLCSMPVLMTSRVDTYRLLLFAIPLTLLSAIGLGQAAEVVQAARVPAWLRRVWGGLLVAAALYVVLPLIYYTRIPPTRVADAVLQALPQVDGPVLVLMQRRDVPMTEQTLVDFALLNRLRREPARVGELANPDGGRWRLVLDRLQADGPADALAIRELLPFVRAADPAQDGTVLLAPRSRWVSAVSALQAEGCRVAEARVNDVDLWVVDSGRRPSPASAPAGTAPVTWKPVATSLPAPPRPTPTPAPVVLELEDGPAVDVSDLTPVKMEFGFVPPKLDRSYLGSPLTISGVTYARGLGMHTWCRVTYDVPAGARAFQAAVGLDDSQRASDRAQILFEIRDQDQRLLWASGPVEASTPARLVRIPLAGVRQVTLIANEGIRGRDNGHANWGKPQFLLEAAR